MATHVVARAELDALMEMLASDGYDLIGPTVRDGSIIYGDIESTRDLPVGWTDEQAGGHYRLIERGDDALFGYTVGPYTWKRYLYPPKVELFTVERNGSGTRFIAAEIEEHKQAFFGVKACELSAIEIQDKVFLDSGYVDANYLARRENSFIVVTECGTARASCFCVSMDTGPACEDGYDLRITEIPADGGFEYLIHAGTEAGEAYASRLNVGVADEGHAAAREAALANAVDEMGLFLDTDGLHDLLIENWENPRWDDVAERCLTCGNCTLVCPTCFCNTMTDATALDGIASRTRIWDSCFGREFTNLHGHPVRMTTKARYRQWMTHKLATWVDQFGSFGCVGCGRCITWCPVGIDITAEVAAMREEMPV